MNQVSQNNPKETNFLKIPDSILKLVEGAWAEPGLTAKSILWQSDFYIENPKAATPWDKELVKRSQLAYYLPLNLVRNMRVYYQLKNNPLKSYQRFFAGIENYWELGSGLSPSYFALKEVFPETKFSQVNFIEASLYAQEFHRALLGQYLPSLNNHNWTRNQPSRNDNLSNDLVVCSYTLTELESIPEWLFKAKALIIVEPATREDGRRLLELRNTLIEKGFQIWSPCLHQDACPLLQETKNDWCHDRVHFEKPTGLQKIENLLPIKNDTLTLSYLIAKKIDKTNHNDTSTTDQASTLVRVVGDFLNEKGKARQMVCRNSKREFLAQLKRSTKPLEFERGDLLKIEGPVKLTSNEIRTEPEETKLNKIN
jgi:ribosomal protein RSM22 (predicted rRNA methylase)